MEKDPAFFCCRCPVQVQISVQSALVRSAGLSLASARYLIWDPVSSFFTAAHRYPALAEYQLEGPATYFLHRQGSTTTTHSHCNQILDPTWDNTLRTHIQFSFTWKTGRDNQPLHPDPTSKEAQHHPFQRSLQFRLASRLPLTTLLLFCCMSTPASALQDGCRCN